jgi:hypothetical protein
MHAQEQPKDPGSSERPRRPVTVVAEVSSATGPAPGAGMAAGGILSLQRSADNSAVAPDGGVDAASARRGLRACGGRADRCTRDPARGLDVQQQHQDPRRPWGSRPRPCGRTVRTPVGPPPRRSRDWAPPTGARRPVRRREPAAVHQWKRRHLQARKEYETHETRFRHALVEAERRLATALDLLQTTGNQPSGRTLHALKLSFPGFQTASPSSCRGSPR